MLKGKFIRTYIKKETKTRQWVYLVSGTEDELKSYEEAQGDYFTPDPETGKPLYFTQRYVDDDITLKITSENKVITDDTELAKLQSLVEQYGLEVAQLIMSKKNKPVSVD